MRNWTAFIDSVQRSVLCFPLALVVQSDPTGLNAKATGKMKAN